MRHKDPELMKSILEYVEDFYQSELRAPTTLEIGKAHGICKATAYNYLVEMDKIGLLEYDGKTVVTAKINRRNRETVDVPRYNAAIPCGPLEEIAPEPVGYVIVRFIYRKFMAGMTPYKIAAELTAQGVPTPGGRKKWAVTTIKSILTNEKYKGDALLQKTFTVDFLTKTHKVNEGEVQQYYVENSHPAIITPEEFDLVQQEFVKRMNTGKQYSSTSIFASKIICGDCGSFFGAKVWHSNSKYRRVIYQCNSKFKGEHFCTTPHLYEPEIQQKFLNAFAQYFEQRETIVKNCRFVLNKLKNKSDEYEKLQAEFDEVNEKLKRYISQSTEADKNLNYQELNSQYEEISAKLDAEEQKADDRKARYQQMTKFLNILEGSESILETFDENVWNAVLENLTVFHDGSMVFLFKDGTEIKV